MKDTQAVKATEQTWLNPSITRSNWGTGDWDREPDKVQWTDRITKLPCLAVRSEVLGSWCGYVGIPASHPLHGKHYDLLPYLEVHGGITFARACQPGPIEVTVCHVPAPGESDDIWWLGFDCAHAWDYTPALQAALNALEGRAPAPGPGQLPTERDVYRPLAYVKAQCRRLAAQLAAEGSMEVVDCPYCIDQPPRNIATTTCEDCSGSGKITRPRQAR